MQIALAVTRNTAITLQIFLNLLIFPQHSNNMSYLVYNPSEVPGWSRGVKTYALSLSSISYIQAFTLGCLTILEDSLHIEAVGGAGLVVGGALQVVGELAGSGIVDYSWVGGTDGILTEEREEHVRSHSA